MRFFVAAAAFLMFHAGQSRAEVTWEQQAERLQNISATLLDGVPFAEPIAKTRGIEASAAVSFLPKTNPTIGGKSEKVPSSPVHMVPTFKFDHRPSSIFSGNVGYEVWAGYLPSGGEKLVNINAKLTQYLAGSALDYVLALDQGMAIHLPLGVQVSSASVKGAITAKDSNDSFTAATSLFYFAPGIVLPLEAMLGPGESAWFNLLLGSKTTSSDFKIPADGTEFKLKDNRAVAQIAAGVSLARGFEIGAGLLYVPERLMMPRLRVGYHFAF